MSNKNISNEKFGLTYNILDIDDDSDMDPFPLVRPKYPTDAEIEHLIIETDEWLD